MKTIRVQISPDGKTFQHIYNDSLQSLDNALGEVEIHRATDIYFDNVDRLWRIKMLDTKEVLEQGFETRQEALDFEHEYLQERMKQVANEC